MFLPLLLSHLHYQSAPPLGVCNHARLFLPLPPHGLASADNVELITNTAPGVISGMELCTFDNVGVRHLVVCAHA